MIKSKIAAIISVGCLLLFVVSLTAAGNGEDLLQVKRSFLRGFTKLCSDFSNEIIVEKSPAQSGRLIRKFLASLKTEEGRLHTLLCKYTNFHDTEAKTGTLEKSAEHAEQGAIAAAGHSARKHLDHVVFLKRYLSFRQHVQARDGRLIHRIPQGPSAADIQKAKKMLQKSLALFRKLNNALEAANTGQEAAAAMRAFLKEIKQFQQHAELFKKTIPDPGKVPELQSLAGEIEKSAKHFMRLLLEASTKYKDDPDFKQALQEFRKM